MSRNSILAAIGLSLVSALSFASGASAQGFAGLLSGRVDLAPMALSSGKPLAEKPYELESGKYYRIEISSDGTQEIAIGGPSFFRNVWVNEIVINGIEVRPLGIDSIEFDEEGTATISFVTIRPGQFELRIPGTSGETQAATFSVK